MLPFDLFAVDLAHDLAVCGDFEVLWRLGGAI
jgi:hypothetical protein